MSDRPVLVPVVLSGGAGTRLWPLSREGSPKPFIPLPDGQTLLEKCYHRAVQCDSVAEVLTVTNRDYYFRCRDEFSKLAAGAVAPSFLLEPVGRNTAPAAAMAALYAQHRFGPESVLLLLPSDHLIADVAAFRSDVQRAMSLAQEGWLVTFGIPPKGPETGFGYLEGGEALGSGAQRAVRFVEKPNAAVAAQYVESGRFYWNAGMFCFTAGAFLAAMQETAPAVLAAARACWEASGADNASTPVIELQVASFSVCPDISIDYAVMEKAPKVAIVPATFDWSDIGSWSSLAEMSPADADGNRIVGTAVVHGVSNSYLYSQHRTIGALGLDDCVVVDTPDALLVATRDQLQNVKLLVQQLKAQGNTTATLPRTVVRPWGSYTTLEEGPRFKIKRIEVRPGASLSLQMHHHRAEHWIVVSGTALVVNGEAEILLRTNESTFIPVGHKHRLTNPGVIELVMIEVQSGDYLGEDDIVRFEDKYGRV